MSYYYFTLFACFAFSLGACVASFLNVCIWRLPREESVVRPGSHCPNCNAPIRWYQNIPIFSWCCLRGRCANCHKPISPRYVIVELLGGVLFLLVYLQWAMPAILGCPPALGLVPIVDPALMAVEALAVTGLILGSFIDLDHFYLPDRVTIGGMVLGVPLSFLVPEMQGQEDRLAALYWSLGGMAGAFLFLWGVGAIFSKLFRKEALGFGDVKLIGAVGAFFGPWAALFTVILSSVVGSVAGVALMVRGRAKLGGFTAVPYGPFLAIGALVWMYWGPALLGWYLRLLAR
jgi:leader peptidase (prepilin peptidase)/N-methyltransferase